MVLSSASAVTITVDAAVATSASLEATTAIAVASCVGGGSGGSEDRVSVCAPTTATAADVSRGHRVSDSTLEGHALSPERVCAAAIAGGGGSGVPKKIVSVNGRHHWRYCV